MHSSIKVFIVLFYCSTRAMEIDEVEMIKISTVKQPKIKSSDARQSQHTVPNPLSMKKECIKECIDNIKSSMLYTCTCMCFCCCFISCDYCESFMPTSDFWMQWYGSTKKEQQPFLRNPVR
jgi:hypothetical protein